ncbi:MAG: hypothetical protein DIU78_001040 [Pseudomonadota bacterium]
MATQAIISERAPSRALAARRSDGASRRAYQLLKLAFVVIPVLAGLDKFENSLGSWTKYAAPVLLAQSPVDVAHLMYAIGLFEVFAGFLVIALPRLGALVIASWLALVMLNLVLAGGFRDIALRDFGLFLGALALSELARAEASPESTRKPARSTRTRTPRSDTLASEPESD